MNNFKVKEIIKFSFYKSIQNKWFIIFNALTLISMVLLLNIGNIIDFFSSDDEMKLKVAVLDENNLIYENLQSQISEKFEIEKINENNYTEENIPDDLVILEIEPSAENLFVTSIISKEGILGEYYYQLEDALYYSRNILFEEKYNVPLENLDKFQSELEINRIMLSVDADDSEIKELIKLFSSAVTYLIAILIFSKIANEISQEKQSKSSEYILTTVSEKEYLFAKIFGNVGVLIFQGLLMVVYYYIAMIVTNMANISTVEMGTVLDVLKAPISIDIVSYIAILIVYNILNLILLCIIQATLSAKTASSSEAGNTVSLLSFIMVTVYILTLEFITSYSQVNIMLSIISCLPIVSAYFIPALMVVGQISTWQILLSIGLLIISIPITFKLCAPIFKNGILDYTRIRKKESSKKETIEDIFFVKRKMRNIGFVIGASIIIYFGIQTIFSLVGAFILPTIFQNIFNMEDISMILQILLQVTSLGAASAFALSYCDKTKQKSEKKIFIKEKTKIIFIAVFLVFALQVILSLVLYPALGLDYNIADTFTTNSNSSLISKIILVITLAVTPAIFEELFFRKAMIDFLSQYSRKFAWFFSALLFGIIHMNLSQGLFAFLIGLVFSGIYMYTNDIKLTILIHFINNGFAALTMILPEIGVLILTGLFGLCFIIGLVLFIIELIKKDNREKIRNMCKVSISNNAINRYKYIFTDYTFAVSMILVFLMSILTENMLR